MSFSRQQYEKAAEQFFRQHPKSFEKYFSPTLLQTLVGAMQSSLPTVTAAKIAFNKLVANGTIQRTDRRSDADDRQEAVAVAQSNLDEVVKEIDAPPLTRNELEYFLSLSNRDLAEKYWADDGCNEFRIRYDRGVREHMFRAPARPQVAEVQDDGGEIGLTPEQYRSMSAAQLKINLRSPKFKLSVMRLIKIGAI
jgi:hypothetical protein